MGNVDGHNHSTYVLGGYVHTLLYTLVNAGSHGRYAPFRLHDSLQL